MKYRIFLISSVLSLSLFAQTTELLPIPAEPQGPTLAAPQTLPVPQPMPAPAQALPAPQPLPDSAQAVAPQSAPPVMEIQFHQIESISGRRAAVDMMLAAAALKGHARAHLGGSHVVSFLCDSIRHLSELVHQGLLDGVHPDMVGRTLMEIDLQVDELIARSKAGELRMPNQFVAREVSRQLAKADQNRQALARAAGLRF